MIIGIDASRAFGKLRTGTENYSYYLIREMLRLPASRDHHFVLFVRDNPTIPTWLQGSNVEVVSIPWKYLWTQGGLAIETWRRRLDVLWIPAHTVPVFCNPQVATVVTIHGLEYKWLAAYNNLLQRWYLPLSTFYAARHADRLIAVSESTKGELVKETGIDPKRITVIYEGVETGEFDDKQEQRRAQGSVRGIWQQYQLEKQKYILFVGTLQPRKNLPALIKAFRYLDAELGHYKLVMAGGKGWQTQEIFRTVVEEGMQARVVFLGRVSEEELMSLYRGARVYVQPSVTEGFGLPVIEAMRNRVPVIASNGGALGEVVGEAGIVVKMGPSFVKDLASAINRVAVRSKLREQLIRAGEKRAKLWTWKKAAEKTLKVLQSSI